MTHRRTAAGRNLRAEQGEGECEAIDPPYSCPADALRHLIAIEECRSLNRAEIAAFGRLTLAFVTIVVDVVASVSHAVFRADWGWSLLLLVMACIVAAANWHIPSRYWAARARRVAAERREKP